MSDNIKKIFIKGVTWAGIERISTQAIQFITTIVLARLLSPKDFGIVGMATIFIQLQSTINQMGLPAAIIQRKGISEEHLSSVFWANIIVSSMLCLITISCSGLAASFFRNPAVNPILFALSFLFIIGSFRGVNYALLTKELKFSKLAFINIGEIFSNGVVSILLAVLNYGAWSLVWGRLFGVLVGSLLTLFLYPWRPKFIFVFSKVKELFKFGANVVGSNLLTYVGQNTDYLVVGRFFGSVSLGIYTMAYNLITLPQRKLSSIVTDVAFPAFSQIQNEPQKLAKGYLKMMKYISLVTFPLLCGLMITAPEFVNIVLGRKWAGAIVPMQIMCLAGMIKSVGTTVGSLFYALGKPDLELKLDILFVLLIVPLLLLAAKWGIIGVAIAVTVHAVISWIICFYAVAKLIKVKFVEFFKVMLPASFLSLSIITILFIYKYLFILYFENTVVLFSSSVCLGVLLYFLLIKRASEEMYQEFLKPLLNRLKNHRFKSNKFILEQNL